MAVAAGCVDGSVGNELGDQVRPDGAVFQLPSGSPSGGFPVKFSMLRIAGKATRGGVANSGVANNADAAAFASISYVLVGVPVTLRTLEAASIAKLLSGGCHGLCTDPPKACCRRL